jgi:hypothetical protein
MEFDCEDVRRLLGKVGSGVKGREGGVCHRLERWPVDPKPAERRPREAEGSEATSPLRPQKPGAGSARGSHVPDATSALVLDNPPHLLTL